MGNSKKATTVWGSPEGEENFNDMYEDLGQAVLTENLKEVQNSSYDDKCSMFGMKNNSDIAIKDLNQKEKLILTELSSISSSVNMAKDLKRFMISAIYLITLFYFRKMK